MSYIRCKGNTQASAALHATGRNTMHSLSPFRRPTLCLCPAMGLETCEEAENHPAIPAGVSVGRGRSPSYLQNWQSVSPLVWEHLRGANEAPSSLFLFPSGLSCLLPSSSHSEHHCLKVALKRKPRGKIVFQAPPLSSRPQLPLRAEGQQLLLTWEE